MTLNIETKLWSGQEAVTITTQNIEKLQLNGLKNDTEKRNRIK